MDYFGDKNQGNERPNSGSSSSARKGKKSNKSKQPQRGLGVAQLEKIRLQNQLVCSYLPSPHAPFYPNLTQEHMRMQEAYSSPQTPPPLINNFHGHQNIMVGMGETGNFGYGDSQHITTPSWIPGNGMFKTQQFAQPSMTRHFMNQQVEDEQEKRKERNDSIGGTSNQNSEKGDNHEVDLELRL